MNAGQAAGNGGGGFWRWTFVVFMLALTVLFVALGLWQMERLGEKETLIEAVETRAGLAPEPLPAPGAWEGIEPESFDYRPVSVSGTFAPASSVAVFTSLSDPQGVYGGAGYWIMTPLVLEDGSGLIWVNRGFVPQDLLADHARGETAPAGLVALEGLARKPERANSFTPAPSFDRGQEWVRDPARLSAFLTGDLARLPVAPITLDRFAGEPGELPQGGETVMTFSNRHLEYAGTWFALALVTPIMLGFWYWRQRKG